MIFYDISERGGNERIKNEKEAGMHEGENMAVLGTYGDAERR